jgi:hypothetical protein
MLNAADSYFEAIEHGKGNLGPFADDCERHENGGQTTHNKTPIPWPVDLGFPMFNHRGGVRSIKIQGVPGVDVIPMDGSTSNLQAEEIFKIRAGKIHEIEAMGTSLPYGTKSGWE